MTTPRHPLAERVASMTQQELEELQASFPSMGAGPQDQLADEIDRRIAALSADQSI